MSESFLVLRMAAARPLNGRPTATPNTPKMDHGWIEMMNYMIRDIILGWVVLAAIFSLTLAYG